MLRAGALRAGGLLFFLAIASFALALPSVAAAADNYIEGEALVMLRHNDATRNVAASGDVDGAAARYAGDVAERAGATVVTVYNALSNAEVGVMVFMKAEGITTNELLDRLTEDPDVISAAPNHVMRVFSMPKSAAKTQGDPE
jgi:hypothetical protein